MIIKVNLSYYKQNKCDTYSMDNDSYFKVIGLTRMRMSSQYKGKGSALVASLGVFATLLF